MKQTKQIEIEIEIQNMKQTKLKRPPPYGRGLNNWFYEIYESCNAEIYPMTLVIVITKCMVVPISTPLELP